MKINSANQRPGASVNSFGSGTKDNDSDSVQDRTDLVYHMHKTCYKRENTLVKCNLVLGYALMSAGIFAIIGEVFQESFKANVILSVGSLAIGESLGEMKSLSMLQKAEMPIKDRTQTIFQMSVPSHVILSKSRNFNTAFGATVIAAGVINAVIDSYQKVNSAHFLWHPYLIGTFLLGMGWGEKNALNNLQVFEKLTSI